MRRILVLFTFSGSLFFFNQPINAQVQILGQDTICEETVSLSTLVTPFEIIANKTDVYTFDPVPYAPELPGGTFINLADDAVSGAQPIGFPFKFFDVEYTQFYIGSNGWISFSPGQPSTYTSDEIPSTADDVPKNCIMGPWQDWHPGIGPNIGQYISYRTEGVAPCRRLIVTYNNIPFFSCTTTFGTFQIILYESTNLIENHITAKPSCLTWAGGTATQGVHNLQGTVAYTAPGRNSSQWEAFNEGTAFVAIGEPTIEQVNYSVTWFHENEEVGVGDNLSHTPAEFPATYIAEVSYGCGLGTFTDTFTVNRYNVQIPEIIGVNHVCFNAQTTLSVSPPDFLSYQWTSGSEFDTTIVASGAYQVRVVDENGCVLESDTFFISSSSPEATIQGMGAFCQGDSILLYSLDPFESYLWSNGSTNDSTFTTGGDFYLIVTDEFGCFDTTFISLTPIALPEANFSQVPESPVNSGVDIQFTDLSSDPNNTPFISWFWEFGDGNDASEQNPVHVYTEPGEYPVMLVVINQFGCLDTIVKTVNVVDEVIIPNVFTPNGDGFNDFFEIKNIQFFGGNQVLIMNRWGRKVFEAADYNNDNIKWDGGDAPAGVYFYVVDVPDRDPQKGTVTLIRN